MLLTGLELGPNSGLGRDGIEGRSSLRFIHCIQTTLKGLDRALDSKNRSILWRIFDHETSARRLDRRESGTPPCPCRIGHICSVGPPASEEVSIANSLRLGRPLRSIKRSHRLVRHPFPKSA